MVGNMGGSSLAMAPAFVVGQLCDVVDLDGPISLIADYYAVGGVRGRYHLVSRRALGRSAGGRGIVGVCISARKPASMMSFATTPATGENWFGHPRGLTILFLTEMWEMFSFFGMRAILVYYMTKHLDMDQEYASLVYGAYAAFVYFTPVFGGMIADRWLGKRRAVVIGGAMMALGHFMMSSEPLVLSGAVHDRAGQRAVPAQPGQPDRRALPRRRCAQQERVQHLLRRHQSGRLPGAAGVRHAGRGLWLALGFRRRRIRHAAVAGDLSGRAPLSAAGAGARCRGARGATAAWTAPRAIGLPC